MVLQMTLLLFTAAAAVKDYRSYAVPNAMILAGAMNGCLLRFFTENLTGVADGCAGILLAALLCGGLFALSMLGAGDLKLLMAVAVYTGPVKIIRIWCLAMVFGAVISLARMLQYGILEERLQYLMDYIRNWYLHGTEAYMDMANLQGQYQYVIPFAVPVFMATAMEMLLLGK